MSASLVVANFLHAAQLRAATTAASDAKAAHEAALSAEYEKLRNTPTHIPAIDNRTGIVSTPSSAQDDFAVHAERTVKLARTAMRSFAARMLKEQGGVCPLCKLPIDLTKKGEGVIDHCHDTGRIRGVLHRSCNAAEGKISNAAARWGCKSGAYPAIIAYLEATAEYLKREPSKFIYPMHKTKEELKDDRNKAAREKRAAAKAAVAVRSRRGK